MKVTQGMRLKPDIHKKASQRSRTSKPDHVHGKHSKRCFSIRIQSSVILIAAANQGNYVRPRLDIYLGTRTRGPCHPLFFRLHNNKAGQASVAQSPVLLACGSGLSFHFEL